MLRYLIVAFLLCCISACNNEQTATSTKTAAGRQASNISASQTSPHLRMSYKLVFFLNPSDGPCRTQHSILGEMAAELSGNIEIQYVQTTVPEDLDILSNYGIHTLPMLLLTDANGNEIQRLAPGIRSADDIRLLLRSIPRS